MLLHWRMMSLIALPALALAAFGANLGGEAQAPRPAAQSASSYVEDVPGIRRGAASPAQRLANTDILNTLLARGADLRLRAGTRIEIARSLRLGNGASLLGDSGGEKPVIFMPAASFNNADDGAIGSRYGPSAVGINFSGDVSGAYRPSDGVRIENIHLVSEQRMGRRLRGIVGQNVTNCSIRNVEISGFPIGVGIALASARGCRISGAYVHDFSDSTSWKVRAQSTGIEIDNDLINRTPSSDILIENFRIERLKVGGPLFAKWGFETDGINIVNSASRVQIANGSVSDVGEGIDMFGSDGTIDNVTINNAYIFGLKFIHGASRNQVHNITINNAGLAGVNFSGSDQASQDTSGNVIRGLRITNVDSAGAWRANSSAGVLISGQNSRRAPRGNQVLDAVIDLGPNGKYGWIDQSTGTGNRGSNVRIRGGRSVDRDVLILYGGGSVNGAAPGR